MKIALMTGTSSFVPVISQAVCNASKAYVRFLGQALHAEMKKKDIHVLTLCPGNMNTKMNVRGTVDEKAGRLPYPDMKKINRISPDRLSSGRNFYNQGWFYKGYRVLSKIIPQALLLKAADGMF